MGQHGDEVRGREPALQMTVLEEADPALASFLQQQIRAFNNEHSPHHRAIRGRGPHPLLVLLRDDGGNLAGGLSASTYWGWLDVDDLWLGGAWRGRGWGRALLRKAEEVARERGCVRVRLCTFGFQARGFYEKQGYRVVGEMVDYPPGSTFYWLRKELE